MENQTLVVLYEVNKLGSLKTLMTFQIGVGLFMDFSHQSKLCVCVCVCVCVFVLSIHAFYTCASLTEYLFGDSGVHIWP